MLASAAGFSNPHSMRSSGNKRKSKRRRDKEAARKEGKLPVKRPDNDDLFPTCPDEIVLRIFNHLDIKDLCSTLRVCSRFHQIGTDGRLWRPLVHRDYPIHRIGSKFNLLTITDDWKALYANSHQRKKEHLRTAAKAERKARKKELIRKRLLEKQEYEKYKSYLVHLPWIYLWQLMYQFLTLFLSANVIGVLSVAPKSEFPEATLVSCVLSFLYSVYRTVWLFPVMSNVRGVDLRIRQHQVMLLATLATFCIVGTSGALLGLFFGQTTMPSMADIFATNTRLANEYYATWTFLDVVWAALVPPLILGLSLSFMGPEGRRRCAAAALAVIKDGVGLTAFLPAVHTLLVSLAMQPEEAAMPAFAVGVATLLHVKTQATRVARSGGVNAYKGVAGVEFVMEAALHLVGYCAVALVASMSVSGGLWMFKSSAESAAKTIPMNATAQRVIAFIAGSVLNCELALIGGFIGHMIYDMTQRPLTLVTLLGVSFGRDLMSGKSVGFNLGALYSFIHCMLLFFRVIDLPLWLIKLLRCELLMVLPVLTTFYPLALCVSLTGLLAFRARTWAIHNLQQFCTRMRVLVLFGLCMGVCSVCHWVLVQDGVLPVFAQNVTPKFERVLCLYANVFCLFWVAETLVGSRY